jgi:ABC-type spermidine/putrescine transport systems, ATPase components
MSYLSVENLHAEYDDFKLDVSFTLEQNEFVSIIGPSGCGKSTTLSLIAGLLEPKSGRIVLEGKDITNAKVQERNIGMVFQNYALFPNLTVAGNVEYSLRLKKLKRKEVKETAKRYLEFIHLEGYEKRKVETLSGGEKQRVALARSLAASPELLLLDEPLSALDAALRRQLRSEIRRVQLASGTPFVYVTHDREEAFALSDRIIVMNEGKVEMEGDPEEIYRTPNSLFTAFFTGDGTSIEEARLIPGATGDRTAFFRPEDLKIRMPSLILDSKDFVLLDNTRILGYDYTGSDYLLAVECNGMQMLLRSERKPSSSVVNLYLPKVRIRFF